MMRRLGMICLFLGAVLCGGTAAAQHTLGVTGGYGYGNARFYPDQETRAVWGCYTAGVTWRYYGPQRFVGGFGIDFEYLQRGFSFLQNPTEEDPAKYQWYTRRVKSLMLPIVWQPHIYLFKNRMRVYLDAAVFFSYNISSTFINEQGSTVSPEQSKGPWRGEYDFKVVRDNRWGYGLAGGGGGAVGVRGQQNKGWLMRWGGEEQCRCAPAGTPGGSGRSARGTGGRSSWCSRSPPAQ